MPEVGPETLRARRSYTQKFKDDAVARVLDRGYTVAETARGLDMPSGTLQTWVGEARRELPGPVTNAMVLKLKRQNAETEQERDEYKRAVSTWFRRSENDAETPPKPRQGRRSVCHLTR